MLSLSEITPENFAVLQRSPHRYVQWLKQTQRELADAALQRTLTRTGTTLNAAGLRALESTDPVAPLHIAQDILNNNKETTMTPEDPYTKDLAALRAAQHLPTPKDDAAELKAMSDFRDDVYKLSLEANPRGPAFTPPTQSPEVYGNPPDPYRDALEALRRSRR
jgi:hypothetical protein